MSALDGVLAVILGGGRGDRLYPLTKTRSKPAVPIAGKYRLVDVPISNCINSGIYQIAILTQFNSVSLHRHITQTYTFDAFHRGRIEILAAEQTYESADWYQGTADAVRKQIHQIRASGADYVLILAGDHLYHMDYAAMFRAHQERGADISVAVQPVSPRDASRFGVIKRASDGRLLAFAEKPKRPEEQARFVSRSDPERPFLGSLGIYIFSLAILERMLKDCAYNDFGAHLIPFAIQDKAIYSFDFDSYWEDIGTIRSFYETNLALVKPKPPFDLFDPAYPLYTSTQFLPPARVEESQLTDVLLAEGSRIERSEIENSIIGLRSWVGPGARIRSSIVMGNDEGVTGSEGSPAGIGPGCQIEGAIIDKNARLGPGVVIRPFPRGTEQECDQWAVRDGIPVVMKGASIPARTVIAPEPAYKAPPVYARVPRSEPAARMAKGRGT